MAVVEHSQYTPKFFGLIGRVVSGLGKLLTVTAYANSRAEKLAYYNQLSDAALAKRGLKREDIVRHVFPEMYYI